MIPSPRNKRIIDRYNAGDTYIKIATDMTLAGELVSRSTVAGVIRRNRKYVTRAPGPGTHVHAAHIEPPEAPAAFEGRGISIFELHARSCRWPIGEAPNVTFCGAECSAEAPYCEYHTIRSRSNETRRKATKPIYRHDFVGMR